MDSTDLAVLKRTHLSNLMVEPHRMKAKYRVTKSDGSEEENNLINKYEEDGFDPDSAESLNLTSI